MPEQVILHERDALPLDGMGNHAPWHTFFWNPAPRVKNFSQSTDVVAINFANLPAETLPFIRKRLEVDDFFHPPKRLDLVVVYDDG